MESYTLKYIILLNNLLLLALVSISILNIRNLKVFGWKFSSTMVDIATAGG